MKKDIIKFVPSENPEALMQYNDVTGRYGLSLTEREAVSLLRAQAGALKETGRIAFSGGIIEKLILAFCDSPYLTRDGYAGTLEELISIFYEFKSDALDEIDDDDAIALMKKLFNGVCAGDIDALRDDLSRIARRIRRGISAEEEEIYDE